MKFCRGKDCAQVMTVNKDLKNLNSTDLDFPEVTRLFINDSLCPYYRGLRNEFEKNYGAIKKYFGFLPLMVQFG